MRALLARRVADYLTNGCGPVCDRCIQEALGAAHLSPVYQIAVALGTTSDFIREKGVCSVCEKGKLVTRAVPANP